MTVARKVHELTNNSSGLAVLAPPRGWTWVISYAELFKSSAGGSLVRLFAINRIYEAPVVNVGTTKPREAGCLDEVSPVTVNPIWQLRGSDDAVISDWRRLLEDLKLKVSLILLKLHCSPIRSTT